MSMTITSILGINRPMVAAHRGFKELYPENTLPAFIAAAQMGVDMIEFDLRRTSDGTLVVLHDETVDRTTDGHGPVRAMTLEQVKTLDAGRWKDASFAQVRIPTLDEFVRAMEPYPDMLFNVELKEYETGLADCAVEALRGYGLAQRCVFTCFHADILAYLHDALQVRTQGFPLSHLIQGKADSYAKMWAVGMEMNYLSEERVREFLERGVQPWCYCPDTPAAVNHALRSGATLMTCNDIRPALQAVHTS